jgi:formylglycine-generating enzyme
VKTDFSKSLRFLSAFATAFCAVPSSTFADEARFFRIVGPTATTITAFTPDGYITWTNARVGSNYTVQIAQRLEAATNWVDYIQVPVSNSVITHRLYDPNPPSGMVPIPAGSFTMGDTVGDGAGDERPTHTVYVSGFYIDRTEVTNDKMVEVMQWAYQQGKVTVPSLTVRSVETGQGLLDLGRSPGLITWNGSQFQMIAPKASGYPCVAVSWYGAVAFCNYRSQMEGLAVCYNLSDWSCNWSANGYRLPTEAEWEKAARGGASGRRFAWNDMNDISHDRANYYSTTSYAYDTSSTRGYHPTFYGNGIYPLTSPVGYFSANGYGLYDATGNVWEWCWDLYQMAWYSLAGATQDDTRGPPGPLSSRVLRGGSWDSNAYYSRCTYRQLSSPGYSYVYVGFRCVRGT